MKRLAKQALKQALQVETNQVEAVRFLSTKARMNNKNVMMALFALFREECETKWRLHAS
jgi:cytochrome c-type biogenesis protein CcmH/NrfG